MAKDKGEKGVALKVPKGTRDWQGTDVVLREKVFATITEVFKKHGGVTIDTPVFELKEILTGKYGEDSKLIYDLADQGGEICSLRYDLTVPFARWLAMNPQTQSIKRYHIAKVWRRDNPAILKGRMREFMQCDFDIAGVYDPLLPDAEILKIITEVFANLGFNGKYTVKLNHRKVLDGMFQVCGVPEDKIRAISSAVDKLDKSPWEEVRKEMIEEKGLEPTVADKIGEFVKNEDELKIGAPCAERSKKVLATLQSNADLMANPVAKAGIDELTTLLSYLDIWGCLDFIALDMSLARGLDYYTGVIYEVISEGSAPTKTNGKNVSRAKKVVDADEDRSSDPSVGIGSIAAGGRYDGLVGMFSKKGQIPCVGISFGVDRIFSIIKRRIEDAKTSTDIVRATETDVYIMALGGKGCLTERMQIAKQLWDAGLRAEFSWKVKPKLPQQFKAAENGGVPFAVILGEDELARGEVKIKEMGLPEGHAEKEGILVKREDLVEELKKRLKNTDTTLAGTLAALQV
ncbi:histidyl-tRNA synthetase [Microthyrium microscopicum]|uniref:Histidine--tRNA ligase, mitochondrial n=1 Tax=Microthyrium microscopicum TaxID=703497 RepID=A0A6A6U0W2_9PEZI|nr:histidyl-tRNA synthetase [Microthyrium microscopicum]